MGHAHLGLGVLMLRMWGYHAPLSQATDLGLGLDLGHLSLGLCEALDF